jgi:hypothetical protein
VSALIERVLAIAALEVGVSEEPKGSNRGPRVEQYQRATGYQFPVPWCLCFCYWCVAKACKALGFKNPLMQTGDCDALMAWAKRNGRLHLAPKRGDIALLVRGNDAYHAFFVVEVGPRSIETIEGNSNVGGSREGYAVVRRRRALGSPMRFVRFV